MHCYYFSYRQIAPVVKYGSIKDIIDACIQRSLHWPKFKVFALNCNMRLEALRVQLQRRIEQLDSDIIQAIHDNDLRSAHNLEQKKAFYIDNEEGQRKYACTILQIGNGNVTDCPDIFLNSIREELCSTTYSFKCDKIHTVPDKDISFTDEEYLEVFAERKRSVLEAFYPMPFNTHNITHMTILAATNKQVTSCILHAY